MKENNIQRANGPNLDNLNVLQGSNKEKGGAIMDKNITLHDYITLWLDLFKKTEVKTGSYERMLTSNILLGKYEIGADKVMVNVGSVGQPRDHDPRACYAILHDGDLLEFRRVPYDIEKTFEKIIKIPELDDFLGERLKQGR